MKQDSANSGSPPAHHEPRRLQVGLRAVTCGPGVTIVEPCNLYECQLGEQVFVGPFCEIQAGAVIGARTRIQSHSFICSGVQVGEDCFIGHGVMFINDRLREGRYNRDPLAWEGTRLGRGVCIGSNATLLPVTVADGVVIGAGAVVTHDLTVRGIYAGNPARLLRLLSTPPAPPPAASPKGAAQD